jgi:hypothetical protein
MSTNEVIIVSETDAHSGTSVLEVITAKPEEIVDSASDHVNVVGVIEAILDPTPAEYLPGDVSEIHDYVLTEGFSGFQDDYFGSHSTASSEETVSESYGTEGNQSDAEAQAHADAATDAQQHTDDAVASGDYEAAAHAREDAENEAWEAGNSEMLHGSSSPELDLAADQQDQAQQFEQQEGRDAQAGDYEAARDDAAHAADATGWADYNVGGSAHSGQADQEHQQEGWAVWEHDSAEADYQSADAYAADGEFDSAAQFSANAVDHQEEADYHGAMGDHDSDMAGYDPSSDIGHDTAYESYDAAACSHDSSSDS